MNRLTVLDAQTHFLELIANLRPGETVQIMEGDKIVARLVAELEPSRKPRKPSAVGTLTILADDDEHLQAFGDYMQ